MQIEFQLELCDGLHSTVYLLRLEATVCPLSAPRLSQLSHPLLPSLSISQSVFTHADREAKCCRRNYADSKEFQLCFNAGFFASLIG